MKTDLTGTVLGARSSRVVVGLVGLVAVVSVAGSALFLTAGVWYGTCSGDGGDPFVARASTAGRFCESGVSTAYFLAEVLVPVVVVTFMTALAIRGRRWHYLGLGVVGAVLLLVVQAFVPSTLSAECDDNLAPNSDACASY